MAMEITNNYSNYTSGYVSAANSRKQTAESQTAAQTGSIGEAGLSKGAQALLEKLRKSYSDMDFMVADFDKGDNAKDILSRSTKEVSVIFSSSELEKMASDEKYEKEYMERVQGALRMSEQINREFGFTSAFGEKSGNSEINRIGIWRQELHVKLWPFLDYLRDRGRHASLLPASRPQSLQTHSQKNSQTKHHRQQDKKNHRPLNPGSSPPSHSFLHGSTPTHLFAHHNISSPTISQTIP